MYCNLCGNREDNTRMFKINICRECFAEITSLSPIDDDYEKYMNLIRLILSYYISPRAQLNPVN
ncbi:sigma factor G inhibitor Gin [Wansuia hejianensis]|uniref:Uncharacterized protein n=1 Tax=Wansuia hejianensis TaxID=2763667 RepID=A0A926F1M1_9FIRM|nr:sigma factor G inhibitor Gin [Wansuia hejianensis]MBC8590244.1 hypothetical protein [Wansuia hejianensis]